MAKHEPAMRSMLAPHSRHGCNSLNKREEYLNQQELCCVFKDVDGFT